MIELALLLGLGAVGYVLAANPPVKEEFATENPRPVEQYTDEVHHSQQQGHGNEVPYFGANVTQSMYSGATDHILDHHTGAGKEYFQKRETKSFYDVKPGVGNPFGQPVNTDFEQSRMVTGMNMKNVFPIDQVRVGPGSNDGYTNLPKGGYQQDSLREYALPKTTDELRIATKPKLTFTEDPVPGASHITNAGIQAPINKNKPDKFAVLGMDRANTAVGSQVAQALYPEQPLKEQARQTTQTEYFGSGGREGSWESYIRAFTEPYQEFMKLTAEGRPNPAGLQGSARAIGADMFSIQTKKDESVLSDATRLNVPQQIMIAASEHLGSFRYNEPLQQDINVSRNDNYVIEAYKNNPFTQSLNSI